MDEIPLYIKAGSIIPMQKYNNNSEGITNTADAINDYLILNIFSGNSGEAIIYDDEGNNQNYIEGKYSTTKVNFNKSDNLLSITINPVEGSFEGMPEKRAYELRLPNTLPPVEVKVNGGSFAFNEEGKPESWNYNGNDLTTNVFIPQTPVNDKINIEVNLAEDKNVNLSGKKKILKSLQTLVKAITNVGWSQHDWDESKANSDSVLWLAQTGYRMSSDPASVINTLKEFDQKLSAQLEIIKVQAREDTKMYKPYELLMQSFIKE